MLQWLKFLSLLLRLAFSNCGNEIIYRIGIASLKVEVRDTDPATGKMAKASEFVFDDNTDEKLGEIVSLQATRFRVTLAEGVSSWKVYKALSDIKFLQGKLQNVPDEEVSHLRVMSLWA